MNNQSSPNWYDKAFFKGAKEALPFIQWALMVSIAIGGIVLYYRDSNVSQAQALRDLETRQERLTEAVVTNKNERLQQIGEIKKEMLPRELFEARIDAVMRELERQGKLTERILEQRSDR